MPQIHKKIRKRSCAKVGPLYGKVLGFGYKKWAPLISQKRSIGRIFVLIMFLILRLFHIILQMQL